VNELAKTDDPTDEKGSRCLIVERHDWETGTNQRQLQFVLQTAKAFFGCGNLDRTIRVRVFMPANAPKPAFEKNIIISREYGNGTRRTNNFPEMGNIPSSFVFFQETEQAGAYDFWWQIDKAIVAARFQTWQQGRNTQYGRGRLSLIVHGKVPRVINQL